MTKIITRYKGQKVTANNFTMLAHRLTRLKDSPYIDWDAPAFDELDDTVYDGMVNALGVRLSASEADSIDWDAPAYDAPEGGTYSDLVDAFGVRLTAAEVASDTYSEGDWDSLIGGDF